MGCSFRWVSYLVHLVLSPSSFQHDFMSVHGLTHLWEGCGGRGGAGVVCCMRGGGSPCFPRHADGLCQQTLYCGNAFNTAASWSDSPHFKMPLVTGERYGSLHIITFWKECLSHCGSRMSVGRSTYTHAGPLAAAAAAATQFYWLRSCTPAALCIGAGAVIKAA